jgi:hypothetical protein
MSNTIAVNCELYWGFFDRTNEMSGKYQVDICNLSDKAVEALEELGLQVRNKGDEKGNFITVKSSNPIKVFFDRDIDEASPDMVGNGSKAKAAISFYDWSFRGKKGRSPSLKKLVVTDLQVYEGGNGDGGVNLDDVL